MKMVGRVSKLSVPVQAADVGDLAHPNPAFEPLFATVNINVPLHSRPLVALQVTRFDDGGVCVAMVACHALFDGVSTSIFLQNISSCARGEGISIHMDKAPRELIIKPSMWALQRSSYPQQGPFTKQWSEEQRSLFMQPVAARRLNFSQEDLAHLRVEALSKQQDCTGVGFKACSRFQALAAHLWKAKAKSLMCKDTAEEFQVRFGVNVRGRIVAGIPVNYIGNAFMLVSAAATVEELREKSLAFAVEKIQEAMRKQGTAEGFQAQVDSVEMLGGSARIVPCEMGISSVVGLGFYEADFGWGKPAYLGHPHKQRASLVVITEGNAQSTSWNVLAVFPSHAHLQKFQDALVL